MSGYVKTGVLVGGLGFLTGIFSISIFMGLPVGNILLAIPVGIITGRALSRGTSLKPISKRRSLLAGLISGTLSSLAIIVPLMLFAFTAPRGATLGAELSRWVDPKTIPEFLNSLPTALILAAIISAFAATGLTVCSCQLSTRYFNRQINSYLKPEDS